jgi:non-specific serine/threonine protein kinase/serine/threonine-protein kinase
MDPGRWSRVKELALEALERSGAERGAFLESSCAGDAGLRREVEGLLKAYESAEGDEFLAEPAATAPGTAVFRAADPGTLVGVRIGNYRVRRLIGTGGMGAVYEAVQETPRRTVALKVMRAGLASRSAQRRFEYESQLLARLRHPGIAQVFDAGEHQTETGTLPYFAMEYIPGARPITDSARQRRLPTRERLDLMGRVCEAVQHGHQKGIVHRDLKPTNILVDSSGNPKIIDFGVARATDSDLVVTTLQTGVGQLVGTLQYMSPEQCAADPTDIDTRSDVYSLGVVLYELLTDRLPYDLSRVPVYEAPRVVREQAPERPSGVNPALRGDLQIILLKALEKDRNLRYQSAAELGLDLRRYLAGEAIAARPPSVAYQLRLLARKHRTLVASVAAVLLALAAGVVVSWVGFRRAIEARDLARDAAENARAQAARAERITSFLKGMLRSVDPSLATGPAPGGALALDPDYVPWEVLRQTSWEYAGRPGEPPTAVDLLKAAAHRMNQTFPDDPSIRGELAALIGMTLGQFGHWGEGIPLLKESVELQRQTAGETDVATIATMLDLAGAYNVVGDWTQASETYRAACEASRKAFGPVDPKTLQAGRLRVEAMVWRGDSRDEALRLQREAIELVSRRLGPEEPSTYTEISNLAMLLEVIGKADEALPLARQAADGLRRVAGTDRRATIDALARLGHVLRTRGGPGALTEAVSLHREVLAFYESKMGPDHGSTLEFRKSMIELLLLLDRPAEAEPQARAILVSHQRMLGVEDLSTLKADARLARVLIAEGAKLEEAEKLAKVAAERTPRITSPTEDYAVYHGATYADARRALGDPEDGLRQCTRLLDLVGTDPHNARWALAYVRGVQARCLTDLNRYQEAEVAVKQALADADSWGDPASAIRIGVIRSGARLYERWGNADESSRWKGMLPPP